MRSIYLLFAAIVAAAMTPAAAALNVFATVPEWGALVDELGMRPAVAGVGIASQAFGHKFLQDVQGQLASSMPAWSRPD